mgnify:FL=1
MRRRLYIILLLLGISIYSNGQSAQKQEIERLRKEISEIDKQLKANEGKSSDATAQLALTRRKIAVSKSLVSESERELASINQKMRSKSKEIKQTQARLDDNLKYYQSLIKSAYLSRDPKLRFLYVLSGENIQQVVRRFNYLREASDNLRDEAYAINKKKEKLNIEIAQLDSLKQINATLLSQRNSELSKLKSTEKKEQQIINKLQKNKTHYLKEKKNKQQQINALNKKIAQMIAQQNKKSKSSPQKQVDIKLSKEFAANKGKLPWPVDGTIVGKYGKQKHPVYKNIDLPFNNGINISTASNAQVHAVFNGIVCQVVVMPGYNQCVLVQHGEYYTFYCRLKQVNVKAGDKVSCGDVLGIVDTIGGETQLHFQLWKGTNSQNPEPWLL